MKAPKTLAPVRKHHARGPRAHTVRGGRAVGLGCDDTLTPSSRGPLIRGPSLRLPARPPARLLRYTAAAHLRAGSTMTERTLAVGSQRRALPMHLQVPAVQLPCIAGLYETWTGGGRTPACLPGLPPCRAPSPYCQNPRTPGQQHKGEPQLGRKNGGFSEMQFPGSNNKPVVRPLALFVQTRPCGPGGTRASVRARHPFLLRRQSGPSSLSIEDAGKQTRAFLCFSDGHAAAITTCGVKSRAFNGSSVGLESPAV